jgi:hypothetical protein
MEHPPFSTPRKNRELFIKIYAADKLANNSSSYGVCICNSFDESRIVHHRNN